MTSRAILAVAVLLLPGGAAAQRSFDISAGGFWGGHAPDGPVSAGWVQASRFLDQWVFEGASRVDTVFEGRASDFDGDVRVTREDRYETLMGGLRSPLGHVRRGWGVRLPLRAAVPGGGDGLRVRGAAQRRRRIVGSGVRGAVPFGGGTWVQGRGGPAGAGES